MHRQADPSVSVVVATRNRRDWLEGCVTSVLTQKGPALELIVVDDASTDDTCAWLRTIDDPRLVVVPLPSHAERCTARNLGLDRARGDYVMFLDDDDTLEPDALSRLAAALAAHPTAIAAVGARRTWFSDEGYRRRDPHPRVEMVRSILDDLLADWSAVSGQCLYRAALVRQVGGYDAAILPCEDRDLWLRLAPRGPVVLCPAVTFTYRIHGGQVRPADIRRIRDRVAATAIAALPAGERRRALRLRRTARLVDLAEDEVAAGSVLRGSALALTAVLGNPAAFVSPLVGPWAARRLAGRLARRVQRG